MRVFHRAAHVLQRLTSARSIQRRAVSREAVLARWNARPEDAAAEAAPAAGGATGVVGKGMKFASAVTGGGGGGGGSGAWGKPRAGVASTIADVSWDLCERLDFYVQYSVPSNWWVTERVGENSLAIQCRPPPAGRGAGQPTVHGFSLNCFAYRRKVQEPDSAKLLSLFLQRFNASVSNSVEVVSRSAGRAAAAAAADASTRSVSESLASRLDCAVAEITFTPVAGEPLAHGLCRAFYNSNHKFHYVVVVAVPEDEFAVSLDLLTHALLAVVEGRVEAAAKRT
ncbi:uncharacterized protein Tco025E_06440 [Trypanosoma conorhini]|uniref:Uncharacterized protein n=1 Tax=Trypanosoma conorhini TaxID=83891 RepID=A0A422P509_9TRYP|nr:uncharacterized protein Tco025E_06440 [Trypanosoma conorhini]RNF12809.1 hypothetical protein Tco025E_06440 [Trypanosoma conorhini]